MDNKSFYDQIVESIWNAAKHLYKHLENEDLKINIKCESKHEGRTELIQKIKNYKLKSDLMFEDSNLDIIPWMKKMKNHLLNLNKSLTRIWESLCGNNSCGHINQYFNRCKTHISTFAFIIQKYIKCVKTYDLYEKKKTEEIVDRWAKKTRQFFTIAT